MFFSLTNDSFYRCFEDIAYLNNQLTRTDKVYDANGKYFIEQLRRYPRKTDEAVGELVSKYIDVSYDEIYNDFSSFIKDLEDNSFVVTGDTPEELNSKMRCFSYSNPQSKTLPQTHYEINRPHVDTTDFMYSYFKRNPKIFSFQMELTSRCNEKCRHCYLPNSRDMRDMDTSLALNLMEQLADEGTLGLTLSGGECLLHKDFILILKHARKLDFSISILSNVTLLTDELTEAIKEANINLLQVSVYSMDAEEHDWVTQMPGSHSKTMKSLEKLIAADIPVQISCPAMKKTYKSYQGVLNWAYAHRIKGYTDFIMMGRADNSTDNLSNRLSLDETSELLKKMLDIDIEYMALLDSNEEFIVDENMAEEPVCGAGNDSMCVTASGNFYPCAGFQGYLLGNAYNQTVSEVWKNSEAIKRLRDITWKDFPKCLNCTAKPFCSMCMVRNYNESGDIYTINRHFCDVAFLNKKLAEEYRLKLRTSKRQPVPASLGREVSVI